MAAKSIHERKWLMDEDEKDRHDALAAGTGNRVLDTWHIEHDGQTVPHLIVMMVEQVMRHAR